MHITAISAVIFTFFGISWGLTYNSLPGASIKSADLTSTTWNNFVGGLGVDASPSTCAQTGFEMNSSMKVALNTTVTIKAVKVIGAGTLSNIEINMEDTSNDKIPERCARWITGPIDLKSPGVDFPCKIPLTGNVLTLKTTGKAKQVSICDLKYA